MVSIMQDLILHNLPLFPRFMSYADVSGTFVDAGRSKGRDDRRANQRSGEISEYEIHKGKPIVCSACARSLLGCTPSQLSYEAAYNLIQRLLLIVRSVFFCSIAYVRPRHLANSLVDDSCSSPDPAIKAVDP